MRAIVWVDATPLLRDERERLRSVRARLAVADERLRKHKQGDEPDYQRWFNATFASRLGEIRELYEKLAELDAIVWRVEREILATGASAAEAYAAVIEQMDQAKRAENEDASGAAGEDETEEPFYRNAGTEDAGTEDADDAGRARREGGGGRSDDDSWRPNAKAPAADDMIKQVYRQLVRRLHPDLNPELPEELREKWFEVQQAYDDRDLARLEMILSACENGDGGDESFIERIQSLSRLKSLIKSVAKKLKTQQRALTQAKRQPAWEFHKKKRDPRKLMILEREVKFELRNAGEALESDIRTLEAQIERWKRPTAKRNKRSWDLQFDF